MGILDKYSTRRDERPKERRIASRGSVLDKYGSSAERSSSTPTRGTQGRIGATSQKTTSPYELQAKAEEIGQVAPKLGKEATALAQPKKPTFLDKALGQIGALGAFVTGTTGSGSLNPVDWVKKGTESYLASTRGDLGDVHTFGKTLEQAFPEGGTASKWAKRVGGFAGDVALDPTTYVTGGAGGAGRAAARSAGEAALTKAVGKELTQEAAEKARNILLSDTSLSTATKRISKEVPEAVKVLPKETQGGIRVRAPLSRFLTGKEKSLTLVPGKVTSRIVSPIAEPVRKITHKAVDAVTPLSMQRKGKEGYEATKLYREAGNVTHKLQSAGPQLVRGLQKAFKDADEATMNRAIATGAGATPAQTKAVADARGWLDEFWATSEESAAGLPKRTNYWPERQFTNEFLEKTKGNMAGSPGVDSLLDSLGSIAKERGLAEMTRAEAADFMRKKFALADDFPVYETDPVKSMANYILDAPQRLKTQRFAEGLKDKGYLMERNALRDTTIPEGALVGAQAGRQAATDARLAHSAAIADVGKALARGEPVDDLLRKEAAARTAMGAAEEAGADRVVGHIPEGWSALGQSKYLAPSSIADFITKEMVQKPFGPQVTRDFLRNFKRLVTIPFPGFHLRNFRGSQMTNLTRGGSIRDIIDARRIQKAPGEQMFPRYYRTADQLRGLMDQEDVLGGPGAAQLRELLPKSPDEMGPLSRFADRFIPDPVMRAARAPIKAGEKAMSAIEGAARRPAYLHGLAELGDPYAARQFVASGHGNYAELSPFETKLKEFVPFYKWARANLPHQAQMLAERPGRAMIPMKLNRALSDEDNSYISDLDASQQPITVGGKRANLDFPLFDVNAPFSQGVGKWAAAASHPAIKFFLERTFKERTYGNGTVRDWAPAGGILKPFAQAAEKLPLFKNLVLRNKESGELHVKSWVPDIVKSLPTSRMTGTAENLTEGDWASLLSTLAGVGVRPIDEERELYWRKQAMNDAVYNANRYAGGDIADLR